MTDSKSRFESWAVDVKGWNLEQWEDDRYKYHHDAWLAWQACEAQSAARIAKLREMVNLQCSNGNWNCNSYMHGMANGMIFLLAMLENKEPQYLKAPDVWLDDLPRSHLQPMTCEALTSHQGE